MQYLFLKCIWEKHHFYQKKNSVDCKFNWLTLCVFLDYQRVRNRQACRSREGKSRFMSMVSIPLDHIPPGIWGRQPSWPTSLFPDSFLHCYCSSEPGISQVQVLSPWCLLEAKDLVRQQNYKSNISYWPLGISWDNLRTGGRKPKLEIIWGSHYHMCLSTRAVKFWSS